MTTAMCIASLVVLTNACGRLSVDAHGARAVSYVPSGGAEVFATLSDGSGGMPICWPWFGDGGREGARRHGIARYEDFRVVRRTESPDAAELELRLDSSDATKAEFPFDFSLSVVFRLAEAGVSVTMTARNTGDRPFRVTEMFHPYFAVANPRSCRVEGSFGSVAVPCDGSHRHAFPDGVDHAYLLSDPEGGRRISLSSFGDSGVVVWNPGPRPAAGAKITSRLAPDDWRRFVCVENGTYDSVRAYELVPGEPHACGLMISVGYFSTKHPKGET